MEEMDLNSFRKQVDLIMWVLRSDEGEVLFISCGGKSMNKNWEE